MKPDYILISAGCLTCRHFHPHYERRGRRYVPLFCGHCGYREKQSGDPVKICANWAEKSESPAT